MAALNTSEPLLLPLNDDDTDAECLQVSKHRLCRATVGVGLSLGMTAALWAVGVGLAAPHTSRGVAPDEDPLGHSIVDIALVHGVAVSVAAAGRAQLQHKLVEIDKVVERW